jgi:hypothetical protein
LKNVEADATIGIYVGMKHLRQKFDHWGLVGVLLGKLHLKRNTITQMAGIQYAKNPSRKGSVTTVDLLALTSPDSNGNIFF